MVLAMGWKRCARECSNFDGHLPCDSGIPGLWFMLRLVHSQGITCVNTDGNRTGFRFNVPLYMVRTILDFI